MTSRINTNFGFTEVRAKIKEQYDYYGYLLLLKMAKVLPDNLGINYNISTKKITILNSCYSHKRDLQNLFFKTIYRYWKPKVLEGKGKGDDLVVELVKIGDLEPEEWEWHFIDPPFTGSESE